MNILYILDTFPSLSETFILREIKELDRRGVPITILSLNKPGKTIQHPDAIPFAKSTIYAANLLSLKGLINALAAFIHAPLAVLKITSSILRNSHFCPRFTYHRLKGLYLCLSSLKALKECNIGHIHAHFAYLPADTAAPLAQLLRINWSLSVHAWDIFVQKDSTLKSRIEDATKLFFCTKSALTEKEHLFNKLKPDNVLMYHGLEIPPPPSNHHVSDNIFLSVARLETKKGLETLVEACSILKKQHYTFKCKIIGIGPLKKKLAQLIAQHSLTDSIELVGALDQNQIQLYYKASSIFILPCCETRKGDHDGLPNVILEAMSYGLPVISTPVGGIPEIIQHEENGLLVESQNPEKLALQLKSLLENHQLSAKLAERAYQTVKKGFDISETIQPIYHYFTNDVIQTNR